MRRYLILCLILAVCSTAFADTHTYYVATAGNDTTGDGLALVTAWASLGKAIDNHTAESGDTVVINVPGGDTLAAMAATIDFDDDGGKHDGINFVIQSTVSGTQWTALCSGDVTPHFTFSNVTTGSLTITDGIIGVVDNSDGLNLFDYAANKGIDVTMTRCTIVTRTSGLTYPFLFDNAKAPATRNVTLTDCTINTHYGVLKSTGEFGDFTVTGGTTTPDTADTGNWIDLQAGSDGGDIKITDVTQGGSYKFNKVILNVADAPILSLTMRDCTFSAESSVIIFPDDVYDVYVADCTLTSDSDHTIKVGTYDLAGTTSRLDVDAMTGTAIVGNTITCGTGGVFSTTYGSRFVGNKITGTSHVLALYGNNSTVVNNVISGALCLMEWSDYNYIANNTVYATGNAYLSGVPSQEGAGEADGWQYSRGSVVVNNIFMTTGAGNFAFWDYEGNAGNDDHARGALTAGDAVTYPYDDYMSHLMDYNCYYNSAGNAFKIGPVASPTTANTVAAIQTAWTTAGADSTTWNKLHGAHNDLHSVVTNPRFINAAAGDFRLKTDSPLWNAGRRCIENGWTTIGANQPYSNADAGYRSRYNFRDRNYSDR